jgi:hypothetical protein
MAQKVAAAQLTDEEDEIVKKLCFKYHMSRSRLVRFAIEKLAELDEETPSFDIWLKKQGKKV